MAIEQAIFRRSELLLGDEAMSRIGEKRVIIFGVGGVGSWCAESLIRSGIRKLTIVDSDRVCITNINRQLMATTKTVGQVKVPTRQLRLYHRRHRLAERQGTAHPHGLPDEGEAVLVDGCCPEARPHQNPGG